METATVLTLNNGTLNLISESAGDYIILNNRDDPTEKLGTAKIDGTTYTVSCAGNVKVHGKATVNTKVFNGSGDLTISTDKDGKTAKLFEGTVTVDGDTTDTKSVETFYSGTLTAASGTRITTAAANGEITTISDINAGESFTLGSDTYKYIENLGLVQMTNGQVSGVVKSSHFTGGTLTLANLEVDQVLALANGTVDLTKSGLSGAYDILDSLTNPTKKVGTANVNESTYTVTPTDGTFKVKVPSGAVTVNEKSFNGTTVLTLDPANNTAKLDTGTVTIENGGSVEATSGTLTAGDNSAITVEAADGTFSKVGGIDTDGESFTFNDGTNTKTYKRARVGIVVMDGDTISKLLTGGYSSGVLTFASIEESNVLAAADKLLDLSNSAAGDYIVLDSSTYPSETIGTVTIAESEGAVTYTINYGANNVKVKSGDVTVNGVKFNGTSDSLRLYTDSDGTVAMLVAGKVTINATATDGTNSVTTSTQQGKSMPVKVTSGEISVEVANRTYGEGNYAQTTLSNIDVGDAFEYKGNTYGSTDEAVISASAMTSGWR